MLGSEHDNDDLPGILYYNDQLHEENPKTYWKIINDLKNDGAVQDSNCISPSVWLTHFKNLNK